MLFNKIRTARQADGRLISAMDLTISSLGIWSCASCGNSFWHETQGLLCLWSITG